MYVSDIHKLFWLSRITFSYTIRLHFIYIKLGFQKCCILQGNLILREQTLKIKPPDYSPSREDTGPKMIYSRRA